jgi:hypothetical protein
MVFAEPRLVIAALVEPADEVEIVLERQRRINAGLVKGGEEDTEAQPRRHGDLLWVMNFFPPRAGAVGRVVSRSEASLPELATTAYLFMRASDRSRILIAGMRGRLAVTRCRPRVVVSLSSAWR